MFLKPEKYIKYLLISFFIAYPVTVMADVYYGVIAVDKATGASGTGSQSGDRVVNPGVTAITVDKLNKNSDFPVSYQRTALDGARDSALNRCKNNSRSNDAQCETVLTVIDGCGAVAWSSQKNEVYTYAREYSNTSDRMGSSISRQVEEGALKACNRLSGGGCRVIETICTP